MKHINTQSTCLSVLFSANATGTDRNWEDKRLSNRSVCVYIFMFLGGCCSSHYTREDQKLVLMTHHDSDAIILQGSFVVSDLTHSDDRSRTILLQVLDRQMAAQLYNTTSANMEQLDQRRREDIVLALCVGACL